MTIFEMSDTENAIVCLLYAIVFLAFFLGFAKHVRDAYRESDVLEVILVTGGICLAAIMTFIFVAGFLEVLKVI